MQYHVLFCDKSGGTSLRSARVNTIQKEARREVVTVTFAYLTFDLTPWHYWKRGGAKKHSRSYGMFVRKHEAIGGLSKREFRKKFVSLMFGWNLRLLSNGHVFILFGFCLEQGLTLNVLYMRPSKDLQCILLSKRGMFVRGANSYLVNTLIL